MEDLDADIDGEFPVPYEKPVPEGKQSQLPQEIIIFILSFIPLSAQSQRDLASLCLVSRSWYWAAVVKLYHRPNITSKNFDAFVKTICPSINQHVRPSHLSQYVQVLDMSRLTYHGSKTLTARILGRVKQNLISFFAPVTTFSLASYAALGKCIKLQLLSLEGCMEAIEVKPLFKTICKLQELRVLTLRSLRHTETPVSHADDFYEWPPNLEQLKISGGLLDGACTFLFNQRRSSPDHLRVLSIPTATYAKAMHFYPHQRFYSTIRTLHIVPGVEWRPFWGTVWLSCVLARHPEVRELSISVSDITVDSFRSFGQMHPPHPLELLILEGQDVPASIDFGPKQILEAVQAGALANLREVHVGRSVPVAVCSRFSDSYESVEELSLLMADLEAAKAAEKGNGYAPRDTGVFFID